MPDQEMKRGIEQCSRGGRGRWAADCRLGTSPSPPTRLLTAASAARNYNSAPASFAGSRTAPKRCRSSCETRDNPPGHPAPLCRRSRAAGEPSHIWARSAGPPTAPTARLRSALPGRLPSRPACPCGRLRGRCRSCCPGAMGMRAFRERGAVAAAARLPPNASRLVQALLVVRAGRSGSS